MPWLKVWLPALALVALLCCAPAAAQAQTVTFQRICAPSHSVVALLRQHGLAVVDTWPDDAGWPIEIWSDGGAGRAVVMIAASDTGALQRCLVFVRSPEGAPS